MNWMKFDIINCIVLFSLGAIMSSQRGQSSHGSKAPIDLDQIWSDLLQGIEKVYNKQAMSKKQYMDLYT
jgi:hypothetical protein